MLETVIRLAVSRCEAGTARDVKSIFVLRNNDIGDVLVATPLFAALRNHLPDAHIAIGVGDWASPVLFHNPNVDQVIPVNAPWYNKYRPGTPLSRTAYVFAGREVRTVRAGSFDVGIDILGSGWGSLLLCRAGISYRLGTHGYAGGEAGYAASVPFDPALNVSRATLRFAEKLGATELPPPVPQLFLTEQEIAKAEAVWRAHGSASETPRLLVGPGGGLASRLWPVERFADVLRNLPRLGDLDVLIVGGLSEEQRLSELAAVGSMAKVAKPSSTLREAFALVSTCDVVLCNSSMLLHVAAAFRKKAIVVLGESFASAEAHQRQWGYPGISLSLGNGPGGALATPAEVIDVLAELIAARDPSKWVGERLRSMAT